MSAKKSTKAKTSKAPKAKKEPKEKELSAINAAAQVLASFKEPMDAKDIIEARTAKALWTIGPGDKSRRETGRYGRSAGAMDSQAVRAANHTLLPFRGDACGVAALRPHVNQPKTLTQFAQSVFLARLLRVVIFAARFCYVGRSRGPGDRRFRIPCAPRLAPPYGACRPQGGQNARASRSRHGRTLSDRRTPAVRLPAVGTSHRRPSRG